MVRDDLWGLGNTTIRNPERIPGAIKVFQKFYHNKKSFAKSKKKGSSQKRQQEFEKKLGRYTEEGNPIKRKNQIAIADYNTKKESKRPGKNGRMWLSIMDDYGMTNSYNEKSKYEDPTNPGKAYITETGKVFSKYKELRNEIFFRQVLKYQVPHYKKQLDNIAIRGGWWFFKLILECDGLTDFEMGIVSLYRTENLVEATKEIRDYRKAYKKVKKDNEKVTDLQDTWKGKLIGSWFKDEYGERVTNLKRLVAGVQNGTINPESIEAELTSKQNKILALGKGADTDRAKQYGGQIKELLENSCFNIDDHITILKKFFGLVKGGTIFSDYVDANSRILLMTGYLNWIQFKDQSPSRLKILDYYYEIVKDAVDNLPCVVTIEKKNNKQKEEYYKYLVNVNKPRLKIDDEEYVEKKIDEMTNELRSLHGSKPKFKKNNIINHSRFKYNQLFVELEKAREENFIRKQNQTKI